MQSHLTAVIHLKQAAQQMFDTKFSPSLKASSSWFDQRTTRWDVFVFLVFASNFKTG